MRLVARRLLGPALAGGLVGGLALIGVMILVMGASGMGYASPLNLGIPAFVYAITPPLSMLPALMTLMGIHLPPAAMAQLAPALSSGHISPMMAGKLGTTLTGMHVPAAQVQMIGPLMTGHATNSTVATLLSQMSPAARNAVMSAMPVSAGHVVVGVILHFAYAGSLGVLFAALIAAAAWLHVPGLRSPAGIISSGVIGGALVYVVMRWGLLPPTNPMMALVPQTAFFLAHLLFGLVVGVALAIAFRRRSLAAAMPPAN
jgi:hypothetical protein